MLAYSTIPTTKKNDGSNGTAINSTRCKVGAPGFEPGTPCSQSRCATGLRHAPSRPEDNTPTEEPQVSRQRFPTARQDDISRTATECFPTGTALEPVLIEDRENHFVTPFLNHATAVMFDPGVWISMKFTIVRRSAQTTA